MKFTLKSLEEKVLAKEASIKNSSYPIITILQTLVILILISILVYQNRSYLPFFNEETITTDKQEDSSAIDNKPEQTATEENEIGQEESKEEVFTGKTVSALIPSGWSIKEYYDADNSRELQAGLEYKGLTELEIIKNNKVIFTLSAIDEYEEDMCYYYDQFKDFNPSHLEKTKTEHEEIGAELEINDYRERIYAEFEWLGRTFRRIQDVYSYDSLEGNNYFEPPCKYGTVSFKGLNFKTSDGTLLETYKYGLTDLAVIDDFEVVDKILGSMKLVK